ncbi:hypothetical protein MKY04_04555 [Lysinibacillus telephonicus]|uniref:hypothetical protein n=1 Tax=Lysinibacillus telephonicus TaxID=1714840 RepID=UPI0031FD5082
MDKIVEESIEMYNAYIPKVISGCNLIINNLRDNKISEGLEIIKNLVEGLDWLQKIGNLLVIHSIENVIKIEDLVDILNEINKALEIEDYLLVADILEYEILVVFEEFKGLTIS